MTTATMALALATMAPEMHLALATMAPYDNCPPRPSSERPAAVLTGHANGAELRARLSS
jgi:hypothetical protein